MHSNPPWSDRLIKTNLEEMRESGMPMPDLDDELGTGHYGAVYSTEDPEIVFKVTSDPTEAHFIKKATPLGFPDGIVEYYAIIDMEGTFRKRGTYGIWREAAFVVGLPHQDFGRDDYQKRSLRDFRNHLDWFKTAAAVARDTLKRSKDPAALFSESKRYEQWAWDNISTDEAMPPMVYGGMRREPLKGYRGSQRVAAAIRACAVVAENMEHTYLSDLVGGALSFYLDNGILLADVHGNNVGRVARRDDYDEGEGPWVITDPGHAVFLDEL